MTRFSWMVGVCATVLFAAPLAHAQVWLKQGASAAIKLGPFLDADDGVTPETGLTIAFADVRLSANGGSFTGQDDGGGPNTHDELGYYTIALTPPDTATLGTLRVVVHKAGSLPVWQDFMVVPAETYDAIVAGTDPLWLTADDVETAETFVGELDANSTKLAAILEDTGTTIPNTLSAIGNNALNASDNSDVLISRLTATRAGYLDKLNVSGNVASATDIGSLESHGDSNWSTATGFATPGDAMTLTSGERTAVGSAVASHSTVAGISTAVTTTIPGLIGTPNETLADDIAGIETGSGLDAAGVRAAIGLASANLDTQLGAIADDMLTADDVETAESFVATMDSDSTKLAAILEDTGTTIPGLIGTPNETLADDIAAIDASGGGGLDAAGVRAAIGLASANLDTQLSGIVSDTEDIQSRLPASLSDGRIVADVGSIGGKAMAADNAKRYFDGSGYGVHPFAGTVSGVNSQTSINITGQSVPSTSGSLVGMTAGFVSDTGGDEGGPVRSYRTIVASSFSTDTLSLTLDSAPDFTVGTGTGIEILPPGFSQTDRAAMLTADDVETAESFVGELLDAAPGLNDVFTQSAFEAAIDGADSTDDIASASATAVWSAATRETTGGTVTTVSDKTGYALSASGVSAVQEGLGTVDGQGALNNAINQVIEDIDGVGTLVNSRLTATRAGYLDKLNVSGNVASAADVGSLESHGDSNWSTATTVDLNADQSGVTIGAVSGAVGSISGVTFPTNFADLAIEAETGTVSADVEAVELSPGDIEAIAASVEGDWSADEKAALRAILGVPSSGTTPETPASGILATIGTATGTTLPGLIGSPATTLAGDIAGVASDIGEVDVDTEAIADAVASHSDIASALAAIDTNLDAAVSDVKVAAESADTKLGNPVTTVSGDIAAIETGGGSGAGLLVSTTIDVLASQTSFTLSEGSSDDSAYSGTHGVILIITDKATPTQKAVVTAASYTGETKSVQLAGPPGFVIEAGDKVDVVATGFAPGPVARSNLEKFFHNDGSEASKTINNVTAPRQITIQVPN